MSQANSQARSASAQTALGMVYALKNDMQSAAPLLDFALAQIQRGNFRKQHLEALYRRALIGFLRQEFEVALADIKEALTLGRRYHIAEFKSRLIYLKGQTLEEVGRPEEANVAYEEALEAVQDSPLGRDEHFFELISESTYRVQAKIPRESPFAFLTFGFLGVVVLAITFFALLAYFVSMAPRRRKKHALQAGPEAVADATASPTTPEAKPVPEATSAPPEPSLATPSPTQPITTFTRCYRRAHEALTKPEEVAEHIDDPILSKYLKQGGIKQKGELYEVTASLVTALDGKEVDSAGVRSALTRGFKKRGWTWPKSFESLRRHFLEHPPQGV